MTQLDRRVLLALAALVLLAGCPAHDAKRGSGAADCAAGVTPNCATDRKGGGY